MLLAIDAGNSRIKWGLYQDQRCIRSDVILHTERNLLQSTLSEYTHLVKTVYISNVAGLYTQQFLDAMLRELGYPSPNYIQAHATHTVLKNAYTTPEKLGPDRWAAMIAARRYEPQARLIVMSGTTTTIESLDQHGNFIGGLILPGLLMMYTALTTGTANLAPFPLSITQINAFPKNTESAMTTGCLDAVCGAILLAWQRTCASNPPNDAASCIITGGAAQILVDRLSTLIPQLKIQHIDNLVLHGIAEIARCA